MPAVAPNSRPATLDDPSQWVTLDSTSGIVAHRSVVIVRFQTSATQAERQAALDSIGGVAVGGWTSAGGPDGFYYVQAAVDSLGISVTDASTKLSALPEVRLAIPYYVTGPVPSRATAPRNPPATGTGVSASRSRSTTPPAASVSAASISGPR